MAMMAKCFACLEQGSKEGFGTAVAGTIDVVSPGFAVTKLRY